MLHQQSTLAQTADADWRQIVVIGDIITWPQAPARLALVVEIEDIRGWQVLTLAPGEADHAQPVRGMVLRLLRIEELRDSGLRSAMRFDLGRRISVAPEHPGLDAPNGRLCPQALARLNAARAGIHALRDIAAERRRSRRAPDRRTVWHPTPSRRAR